MVETLSAKFELTGLWSVETSLVFAPHLKVDPKTAANQNANYILTNSIFTNLYFKIIARFFTTIQTTLLECSQLITIDHKKI